MSHIIPLLTVQELIRDYSEGDLPHGFYFLNGHGEKLSAKTVKAHWFDICEARRDHLYPHEWLIVGAGYDSEEEK